MPYHKAEIEAVKSRTLLSSLIGGVVRLKKSGRSTFTGLCPFHAEKTPSFKCDDATGLYHCFGCGVSGDHIDFLRQYLGLSFDEAIERLGGRRPVTQAEERRIMEQRERLDEDRKAKELSDREKALKVWDAGKQLHGTDAVRYFKARAIEHALDFGLPGLRFVPSLAYYGYKGEDAEDLEVLGHFPAIVGKIQLADGTLIGVHRTYLKPDCTAKAELPVPKRNKPRKILGTLDGGFIQLTHGHDQAYAIGEGWETTVSWGLLERAYEYGLIAGVTLGNIAGKPLAWEEHPTIPERRVPSLDPGDIGPLIELPRGTRTIALLGDGDSDPAFTHAQLILAGKRFSRIGLDVYVDMAAPGKDWNDVVRGV